MDATRREIVVITGASAGVGRAVARKFGRAKARVALLARGLEGLDGARREIEEQEGEALVIPTDVADAEAVERAAKIVEDTWGGIDTWINNAMVSVFSRAWDVTPEEWARVTSVTYLGYVHGTLAALRRMRPRNAGSIVQVGSSLAYRGIPLQAAYCGAKHAIQGFTESVRAELLAEDSRIRLTCVNLPAVNTPQFGWSRSHLPRMPRPVGTIYQPEIAADAIVWAAHHGGREINVGLSTGVVVAGNNWFPGFGDLYLARTAIDGQMRDEPTPEDRKDNLFTPIPGDSGAHGAFTRDARDTSIYSQFSTWRSRFSLEALARMLLPPRRA